jgi:hypothetical protein
MESRLAQMLALVRKAKSHQREGNHNAANDSKGAFFPDRDADSDETGGYAKCQEQCYPLITIHRSVTSYLSMFPLYLIFREKHPYKDSGKPGKILSEVVETADGKHFTNKTRQPHV